MKFVAAIGTMIISAYLALHASNTMRTSELAPKKNKSRMGAEKKNKSRFGEEGKNKSRFGEEGAKNKSRFGEEGKNKSRFEELETNKSRYTME